MVSGPEFLTKLATTSLVFVVVFSSSYFTFY